MTYTTNTSYYVYAIGLVAQVFFSARILLQWILSEKAGRVLSPSLFWVFSIAGSYLLFIYGWLRDDFSILLGQYISYSVYLWNLKEKGLWSRFPFVLKSLLFIVPIGATIGLLQDIPFFINNFLKNDNIPLWLVCFGSMGQIVFTLRFVYQWLYSRGRKESLLPSGFWAMSLVGSSMIVIYGILRLDPILILGQSLGFVAYSRNLIIGHKAQQHVMHK